jgi:hypothetical protein
MRPKASALALGALGALCVASAARAHEMKCTKTVNGQSAIELDTFPATLTYVVTVFNTHPTMPSTALSLTDTLFDPLNLHFNPPPPFTLQVGEHVTNTFIISVPDFQTCENLSKLDGDDDDTIINTFTVVWDLGQASCSAKVVCVPPVTQPPGGATRTMGFFKTHEDSLTQCLNKGSIDLGFLTISTLPNALGLLWDSPAKDGLGNKRSDLDSARIRLARQTLVGICNERLFGTVPSPSTLFADAVTALAGKSCTTMDTLESAIDKFNGSGDNVAFPNGFNPGPSTPQHAQSIATDPVTPSGQTCQ